MIDTLFILLVKHQSTKRELKYYIQKYLSQPFLLSWRNNILHMFTVDMCSHWYVAFGKQVPFVPIFCLLIKVSRTKIRFLDVQRVLRSAGSLVWYIHHRRQGK